MNHKYFHFFDLYSMGIHTTVVDIMLGALIAYFVSLVLIRAPICRFINNKQHGYCHLLEIDYIFIIILLKDIHFLCILYNIHILYYVIEYSLNLNILYLHSIFFIIYIHLVYAIKDPTHYIETNIN